MKEIGVIFKYTLREGIRKKAFVISTVIGMVIVLVLCLLPRLLGGMDNGEAGGTPNENTAVKNKTCYYVGNNIIPNGIEALSAAYQDVDFRPINEAELEGKKLETENSDNVAILWLVEVDGAPFLRGYNRDFMSGMDVAGAADALNRAYIENLLEAQGVGTALAERLTAGISFTSEIVGKMDVSGYIAGIALTMLIFFAVYFYGYGVAMTIATEKTSRVMETLIVSAKPSQLLVGKCLAMGTVGLTQLSALLAFAAVCFTALVPADFTIMGMPLALSSFTAPSALLILVFFLLGYFLYAVLNSVCGAMVSRMEDISSAMMPVMLLLMISFYMAYFSLLGGGQSLKQLVTIVPFTAPFIVPFRLLNEQVPASDIALSIALLIAAIALITAFSIRIYSASVLHYGSRLRIKDFKKLRGMR